MRVYFEKLNEPTIEIAEAINSWENDPELVPLIRPSQSKSALESRQTVTVEGLKKRVEHHTTYLIYLDEQLIGDMNFMVDPSHLFKKEPGTAWIGITIGHPEGRGKGIGNKAIRFLENEIKKEGHSRIELGVFEYNAHARKLYQKLGYQEIGQIENFTYWQGRMWNDIRMEKYI
ncbi:GNAT family N-acetyltransferase [Rossellomorea vietnamensis]|uniref:GNAT family N-acetyltransferase n=1 Tax=Rossellomorea vietnamensis TaxID=218284 RepID=A0A5D4K9D8_9BACI|nr:GNAT family N-acetyltransferase [Rossellomorea vietnamensis]TYR73987.1 GNAT family N-acetyltransferase [Rossellomorea vietnamensis]